ncbi:MAG: penicillin-insensitive murein endopeptidase [Myxococcales bacterium]|nr:penicillin-insensitive murein endopeptidase [Myxococcales bacterium]
MRQGVLFIVTALFAFTWAHEARAKCNFTRPVELAEAGDGWAIPATWARRGLNYGTASMIGLIHRTAKRVAKAKPGSTLYVADISREKGGPSKWHKSHACGCDVDLLFFAVDADGRPITAPTDMIVFNARGVGTYRGKPVQFDTARNWTLVKSLLQDRVRVERLFIHDALKRRLIGYAKRRKESPALVARAAASMMQPTAAGPHDDHLHVRIAAGQNHPSLGPAPAPAARPRAPAPTRKRPRPTPAPKIKLDDRPGRSVPA